MALRFRTADGSDNNVTDPTMNQTNTDFVRVGPANFADGVSELTSGPNAREVSNIVANQADAPDGHLTDAAGNVLSGMMYAWGQFIDHDLDLEASAKTPVDISITVPADDPTLPAGSTIGLTRVATDPNAHVATAINSITGWLDGSQIYGSNAELAASLWMADGHMKTSEGNNLPIVNGNFLAGDVRAQENPDLTALQTLFVREHNHQVDLLQAEHPHWSGDQLYETAKAITTAEMVHITYSEFLPHLLGPDAIPAYHGYDSSVNATISEEFEGAAYRFGHSIVSDDINAVDNNGQTTSEQTLAQAFFESTSTFAATGADGLLRHLAGDTANLLDTHVIDGLRNLLVDPPDGTDLAAINIQRGHDLGLGTLNETRTALGLTPYTSFDQITSDHTTAAALEKAYGNVDAVDLWTGGLAEDHTAGAIVGSTFGRIIGDQFTALRDGDSLYYENQGFDKKTLDAINHTTLSDLILRDTDTTAMQTDAFVGTERHSGTLAGADPSGAEAVPGEAQLAVAATGEDHISGGPLNDTLVAASGHTTMTGGGGADSFVFNFDHITGQGNTATITDYDPAMDHLQMLNQPHDITTTSDNHGGTLIEVGHTEKIDLVGVDPHLMQHHDFLV